MLHFVRDVWKNDAFPLTTKLIKRRMASQMELFIGISFVAQRGNCIGAGDEGRILWWKGQRHDAEPWYSGIFNKKSENVAF